jgi:hypothetical protein
MLSPLVGSCFVLQALAAQVPLGLSKGNQSLELGHAPRITSPYNSTSTLVSSNLDDSSWRLDEPPPANATGRFVFETMNSLLQHWPNTRYRNGKQRPGMSLTLFHHDHQVMQSFRVPSPKAPYCIMELSVTRSLRAQSGQLQTQSTPSSSVEAPPIQDACT